MWSALKAWSQSMPGKITVIAVMALLVSALGYFAYGLLGSGSEMGDLTHHPMMICAETGKTFRGTIEVGTTYPAYSKYSGKNTAYPANACYWTADGHVKKEPTWVLLNDWLQQDKPPGERTPTFCPDCGRRVTGQDPEAIEGNRPPPTREEWNSRHQRN